MKRGVRGALLALALLLTCSAWAETGSISVRLHALDTNVQGALLALYEVGDAQFRISSDFAGSDETLDALNDLDLPRRLEQFAVANGVRPAQTAQTDENGTVRFAALEQGVYLLCQTGFSGQARFRQIDPFLVTVPMTVDGQLSENISAEPKVEPLPSPSPSPTPTPDDSQLPQTGLLRWQVFALAGGGVVLFALGWAMCFLKKGKKRA